MNVLLGPAFDAAGYALRLCASCCNSPLYEGRTRGSAYSAAGAAACTAASNIGSTGVP